MPTYCFRTFATKDEAERVRSLLLEKYSGNISLEYSEFVYRWTLKCQPDDARALYVRSQAIAPIEISA